MKVFSPFLDKILLGLFDVINYAMLAHSSQKRKSRKASHVPYMVHPIEVAKLIYENVELHKFEKESDFQLLKNIIYAAILHDVLEDTDKTEEEIKRMFGAEVLNLVKGVTDDKTKSKKEQREAQLEHMLTAPYGVRLIKVADKISNIRDLVRCPPGWKTSSIRAYVEHAAKVVTFAASHQDLPVSLIQEFWRARSEVLNWLEDLEVLNWLEEEQPKSKENS